jgi:branched-chain amino acid transport system ATP-binding protein
VRPFRNLTVLDNVALAAGNALTVSPFVAIANVSRSAQRDAAMRLLTLVGIESAAHEFPATQPLGILKRLEVARALAIQPSILLLDEPLAGLNHHEANRLAETINAINGGGTTVVLIEHNLGEAQRICDRFVVLDNGRKIADGPVAEVMADEGVITAYLGEGWRNAQH